MIENDVITRLHYLKAIWQHTERDHPETIQMLAETTIIPSLRGLMEFCECVEIGEET